MILLDTHVLVWWVNSPELLSKRAQRAIRIAIEKEEKVMISSISIWEVFLLLESGKLESEMDMWSWLAKVESISYLQFVSVNNTIAAKSVVLPGKLHGDPADRIIIATARVHGATLLTRDRRILSYPHIKTIQA